MMGLYVFAAAAGVPLVLWFLLSGGEEGGEAVGGDEGMGGIMLRRLPLSTMAIVAAIFGICGLALTAVGTGAGWTFTAALMAAVAAGALNSTVFTYLRRSESTASVSDEQLAGRVGRVVLPVATDRRGRVAISVGGQQLYLSAQVLPDATAELEVGAPVLVIDVRQGVASVTRLDPELT